MCYYRSLQENLGCIDLQRQQCRGFESLEAARLVCTLLPLIEKMQLCRDKLPSKKTTSPGIVKLILFENMAMHIYMLTETKRVST